MEKNLTSIIILCHNQLHYTMQCIKSLFEYTSPIRSPYEVIVVDNGSTDGTKAYLVGLEQSGQIKVVYNQTNVGFPKANNQGAAIAKGEYILLLNNDVILTEAWLEKLLRCIRSDMRLAAVGPYANHSSGFQQSTTPCIYKGEEDLQLFARKYTGEEKEVNFLVFFCVLIKRNVWDEIGGLDEEFGKGNFEDNFFCWRVIEKGYKMKVCNCFIHHFGSVTFSKNQDPKQLKEYVSLLARNQKIFMRKIGKYKTISLCMICSDREKSETLKRCLESVYEWIDEICVVFNYKLFPNYFKADKIAKSLMKLRGLPSLDIKYKYIKWTNFADMRNKSYKMATGDYIFYLDVDDTLQHPAALRDLIIHNPDVDVFKFKLFSKTEIGTQEVIPKNSLVKNYEWLQWRGKIHEDLTFSLNEHKAKWVMTDAVIQHHGYTDMKTWKSKNRRNYKFLLEEIKENPQSLTYYHIVNCLMIMGGKENIEQAIRYIDECFEKFQLKHEDALTPKMWVLRGVCCMDQKQYLAAKQSFHKAYDEWQNPEAAVNLAKLYAMEKNWKRVIEILNPIYELKQFQLGNIPFDPIQVECMMLESLGDAYYFQAIEKEEPNDRGIEERRELVQSE